VAASISVHRRPGAGTGAPNNDDKFTPTKHLTPPPHHSSRPAAAHTDTETPLQNKGGVGPVDGPPQPIWPTFWPPKLAPNEQGLRFNYLYYMYVYMCICMNIDMCM